MAIYANDDYEVISIMHRYSTSTETNAVTWEGGLLHIQGLPAEQYPYITSFTLFNDEPVVEADFDNLDRFVANVVPIVNSEFIERVLNKSPSKVVSTANSAISPISMYTSASIG